MTANLHVRNVDDAIVRRMKQRAAENGRSMEAEHRLALEQAFGDDGRGAALREAAALRRRIRDKIGDRPLPRSEDLIREDRDSR